jgi:phosphoglycolate phosphatase
LRHLAVSAMKPALIFDLDGTLVDSCGICVSILSEMLAERGAQHTIDPVAARPWMSHGGQKMVAALLGPACGDPALEIAEFRERYAVRHTPQTALFDHVATGLRQLAAAGHTLAICSNKPQNLVEKTLADTGLAPLFASVVGGSVFRKPKPAPDLLDAVLDDLRVAPADCIFVGDSELDHQVAQARGMPFLFVSYGYADAAYTPDSAHSHACFGALTTAILAPSRVLADQ